MKLSEKQHEIVDSDAKYCCVVAGAGSGKTRTLTEHIETLLSRGKRGEKVLAVTFSNKAANELKERLLQSFPEEEIGEKVYVGTIHNFCLDLVLQRGHSIGLNPDLHIFDDYNDRFKIFSEVVESIPRARKKYVEPDGSLDSKRLRNTFDSFSKAKRNLRFPSDYESQPLTQLIYQEYNDRMIAQNAIDFEDILLYAYRILSEKSSIADIYQRIYRNICVDEAQDLNKAQYEVIKAIAGESSGIFMVGDPNQAIYGFNGSSPDYMLKHFHTDYPDVVTYELLENYRSSRAVIDAAKRIEPSFVMTGVLPIRGEVDIKGFDEESLEAEWVVKKLLELVEYGHPDIEGSKISLGQCAVLARNRYVFKELEEKLTESGIDYFLRTPATQGLGSESSFFKIFDLGLRLIVNPKDTLHLVEFKECIDEDLNSEKTFQEMSSSVALSAVLGEHASQAISTAWSLLMDAKTFKFNSVLKGLEAFCDDSASFNNDQERLLTIEDLHSWQHIWEKYYTRTNLEERSLAHMMRSIALGLTDDTNKDESGLTLSTVHASKGLEYDVVFIIGLMEGVFPDYRAIRNEAQLSEEQHNMFVAITRSRRLCYLTFSRTKMMPWGDTKVQHPSRYINQIEFDGIS